jgi:hypothetical protein
MAEQINIRVNIDANQSNKAIKDLSKEIQNLTSKMLQTKTGSQQFVELSKKIADARVELNNLKNTLDNQKPVEVDVNVNTEGSINSISALQSTIDTLNEEIKGLEIGSDQFKKLSSEVSKANAKLRDTQRQLEGLDFNQTAGEMGKFAGGVSAGFTAITAVIGSGNQEFEAFTTNVIAGMAVTNGLKGVLESVASAQLLLNSAMNANPMFKVVAVVGALIAGLTLLWKRQKDNEKAVRDASIKQEEYNNKLRDSRNSILELSLSLAEYNKNIEDQIFLTNQIIENDFKNEVSEIGKEYGVVSDNLSVVNKELEEYNRLSQTIEQNSLEVNRLKQQETELTQEQIDRITELQDENDKNEKVRVAQLNRIQAIVKNYNETSTKMEIKSVELIANAFVKKEKTIKDSNERLVKDAKKTNDDLIENTENTVKQLTKYRLDYFDTIISREKDYQIQRQEYILQELLDNQDLISKIKEARTELSQLLIKQKETEQRQLNRARIEESRELIKSTKDNIKAIQEEMVKVNDKGELQKRLNNAFKTLKEEEQRLNQLSVVNNELDANEIKLINEKLYKENLNFLIKSRDDQREINKQKLQDAITNSIEKSKFDLQLLKSDFDINLKAYRQQLKSNSDLTIEERKDVLDKITQLEQKYESDRFSKLESILNEETKLRQNQRQNELIQDLKRYEGVVENMRGIIYESTGSMKEINDDFVKYLQDNFFSEYEDIPNIITTIIIETNKSIETIMDNIGALNTEIYKLSDSNKKLTDEEKNKLQVLQQELREQTQLSTLYTDRVEELGMIREEYIKLWDDVKIGERQSAELQLLRLDSEKELVETKLKTLQLLQAERQSMLQIADIAVRRWEGNPVRQTEAVRKQLDIQKDLEFQNLETIYNQNQLTQQELLRQNIITEKEYLEQKEKAQLEHLQSIADIENLYRREKLKNDLEGYKKVFEFAKIGSDAMFEITSNQQNAIYENRNKQIQETFDNENEALAKSKENGLITQEEYDKQIEKLNEDKAKKEKKIEYDKAKQEKEAALTKAAIENAINIIEATPNPAAVALAAFTGLTQLGVIRSQPLPQYERGGLVKGKRHSQGGVPIEVEDGEVILNRNVSKNPMLLQLSSLINESTGGKRLTTTTFNSGMNMNTQNEKIDFKSMVKEIVDKVGKIEVVNVAVNTNKVVRQVQNLENKSKI